MARSQCAEQDVVGAGVVGIGDPVEHRFGGLCVHQPGDGVCGFHGVLVGVEPWQTRHVRSGLLGQDRTPVGHLVGPAWGVGGFLQRKCPGPQRGAGQGQFRGPALGACGDRGFQVRQEYFPGDAVDGQVVDDQQEPSGFLLSAVEPDRAQQRSCGHVEFACRDLGRFDDLRVQGITGWGGHGDPSEAVAGIDRSGGAYFQVGSITGAVQAQT